MLSTIRNHLVHRELYPTDTSQELQTKAERLNDQIKLTENSNELRTKKLEHLAKHPLLAAELSSAAASSERKLAHFTKYTSPWSTESRTEGYPRIKDGKFTLSAHKGVKVYWAEKFDRTFDTQLTLKHKSCNGGFKEAQHKLIPLDASLAERMIDTSSRITVLDLKLAVDAIKQLEVLDVREKEKAVYEEKQARNQKKLDKETAKQNAASHLREGALNIFKDGPAMDYVNKKATPDRSNKQPTLKNTEDPSMAKIWAHSREGIITYMNAALNNQSDKGNMYTHTTYLSEKEVKNLVKLEHTQKHYKPTGFITASLSNSNAVEGHQPLNAVFTIVGKPYQATTHDGADNVFKSGTPFIVESVTQENGMAHVKMRESGVPPLMES
ncbi:hypothetical protein PspS35_00170 [Pseudomonas sp. S35]|uniref:hypothetical protein n=1 Tax=Pseudomonas sp. S35 TaxID=1573719 RepID=UPI00132E79FE|nr:hypothetical protein [Pseudomonas sp. S35]QHF42278.1 hypothetical protein PspS35_00170 [Pseudomonas sp. S35]